MARPFGVAAQFAASELRLVPCLVEQPRARTARGSGAAGRPYRHDPSPRRHINRRFPHRLPCGQPLQQSQYGLFSADFPTPAAAELQILGDALRPCLAPYADLLVMRAVPLAWSGTANPLAGLATTENPNPSFQLPLLGDMEKTIAQLNAKSRRKKYNVQRRRIEAVGGFEHICPQKVEEQHALLEDRKSTRLNSSH